jgi:hypothetical protein
LITLTTLCRSDTPVFFVLRFLSWEEDVNIIIQFQKMAANHLWCIFRPSFEWSRDLKLGLNKSQTSLPEHRLSFEQRPKAIWAFIWIDICAAKLFC